MMTRHTRLLSSAQLAIMAFLGKEDESYASEVFRMFKLISEEVNGGILLFSSSGRNRALWKLPLWDFSAGPPEVFLDACMPSPWKAKSPSIYKSRF